MNLITLFMSLFIMASCNSEQTLFDETTAVKSAEENNYLYELDIHYVATVVRIIELTEEKQELAGKIEKGEKSALVKLESVQEEIERLNRFKEHLLKLPRPLGGKGPIPMPPLGCLVVKKSNCDPKRNLKNVTGIVLTNEIKTKSILVKDEKNNIVGKGGDISKDSFGQPVMLMQADFKGIAQMSITIITRDFGTIISTVPVVMQ